MVVEFFAFEFGFGDVIGASVVVVEVVVEVVAGFLS